MRKVSQNQMRFTESTAVIEDLTDRRSKRRKYYKHPERNSSCGGCDTYKWLLLTPHTSVLVLYTLVQYIARHVGVPVPCRTVWKFWYSETWSDLYKLKSLRNLRPIYIRIYTCRSTCVFARVHGRFKNDNPSRNLSFKGMTLVRSLSSVEDAWSPVEVKTSTQWSCVLTCF